MDLRNLQQQYGGTTLPKLIQHQMKNMDINVMRLAISEILKSFPVSFQPAIVQFSIDHARSAGWLEPSIVSRDLSVVFTEAISELRRLSAQAGIVLNDELLFNGFNYTVLCISIFMHAKPDARKSFGIKLGWFS